MQLKEHLFESALEELQRQSSSSDPFENLEGALLIRRLLMEGTPVVDVINRRVRAPLVFQVRENATRSVNGSPMRWLAGDDIDPATPVIPPRPTIELRRDAFLAHEVGAGSGQSVRVRDVVELVARAMEGAHQRAPDARKHVTNDIEEAYRAFVGAAGSIDDIPERLLANAGNRPNYRQSSGAPAPSALNAAVVRCFGAGTCSNGLSLRKGIISGAPYRTAYPA
jgi:hypothetical protein